MQGRMLGKHNTTLSRYLIEAKERHGGWAMAIGRATDAKTTYQRILFSLLSVSTSFEAGSLAWLLLKDKPNTDVNVVESVIRSVHAPGRVTNTVAYPTTKAADIVAFTIRFNKNPGQFILEAGESPEQWRDRTNIRGLGLAKISFAAALLDPMASDCVCLDRHMTRWFTGSVTRTPNPRIYRRYEIALAKIGRVYGISGFLTQWVVWDWLRGKEESHLILAGG